MRKLKPIVARTPEELADVLGLSDAVAKEWQVQLVPLKRMKETAQSRRANSTDSQRTIRPTVELAAPLELEIFE